jgi:hypothetical protein
MANYNCMSLIGLWGVGANGQCLHDAFGFRIGATGYKYAILQVFNTETMCTLTKRFVVNLLTNSCL